MINLETYISFIILFCLALIVMLKQLITNGYFSCITEDAYTFTSWSWQFIEALKEGVLYPRWLPLNSWGYGSPSFILYPPLAFYLVAFFNIFTGSVIMAMNITKFLSLFLSGVGMFFLVREFHPWKIALLTSSLYVVFPYNIFQFYFVGTFANTVSFIWFAPIILFTYRYIRDRNCRDVYYAGLCYCGLILTHLINAYMFSFVMVAFIIYLSIAKKQYKGFFALVLIPLTGFLLSAAYVLPVLFEKQFFTLNALVSYANYSYYFLLPDMTHKFPQGSLWPVYFDTIIFFIIFFTILFFISLTRMIRIGHVPVIKNSLVMNKFFLAIILWSLFLLLGISTFIWEYVPFFKYIQFPYRWLNITTFGIVFISAVLFFTHDIYDKKKIGQSLFIILFFLTCFILDYKYIHTAHIFTKQSLIPIKSVYWNYEKPIWVNIGSIDKSSDIKKYINIREKQGTAEVVTWKSAERIFTVTAREPLVVSIRTFYFPGWEAYLDGVQTAIKKEQGTGAMLIDIPEGKHRLVLKFEDTPIRHYSKIISLISFISIIFLLLIYNLRSRKRMS